MKEFSVIVPTYKDGALLRKCVESILLQSYPSELVSIIVVNNAPEESLTFQSDRVSVVVEAKPGSYAARNAGLSLAKGDLVAFTDADCIAEPDWLANAAQVFESSNAQRIAGRVKIYSDNQVATVSELYERATAFNQRRNAQNGVSVTANLIVRRATLETVGSFDERLMSGGDIEWNQRATRAGSNIVYSDKVTVSHPARATLNELKKKAKRVAGGRMSMQSRRLLKLIRLGIPSGSTVMDILQSDQLTFKQKPRVVLLALYLRFYTFLCAVSVYAGIERPQRS